MEFLLGLCISVYLIGYGLIAIFFKDLAWDIHVWFNDSAGHESKRTDSWERTQTIAGIIMIIAWIAITIAVLNYEG